MTNRLETVVDKTLTPYGPHGYLKMFIENEAIKTGLPILSVVHEGYTDLTKQAVKLSLMDLMGQDCQLIEKLSSNRDTDGFWLTSIGKQIYIDVEVLEDDPLSIGIGGLTCAPETIELLKNWSAKHLKKIPEQKNIYIVTAGPSGLQLTKVGRIEEEFVAENYKLEVEDKVVFLLDELESESPSGRIVLLSGPPGTGKTHMIRAIMSSLSPECNLIMLPSKLLGEIDGPALTNVLLGLKKNNKGGPIILVIEDADHYLRSRDRFTDSAVSTLLNCTDGIFGSLLDIKVVATTNLPFGDFDDAVMRPGRLCVHIDIGPLDPEHAGDVYKRLTGEKKVYLDKVTLASVYLDASKKSNFLKEKKKEIKLGF